MNTFTIALIACAAVLIIGYLVLKKFVGAAPSNEEEHHHDGENGVCCGRHTVCDKGYDNSYLYFDDEELDRFRGRAQEDYTDEEVEEFRQILYTMRENEVDQWVKCLGTRGVSLPQQIKEEIFLIIQ